MAGKEVGSLAPWKVPYLRRNIGCIFQDYRLLPERTVYENVAFALEVIGRSRSFVRSQVPQILELVGLGKKMESRPNELSGGEQQRVAVARAFVNRPLILLADEPTGNLDPGTTAGIMRLLERINLYGTTVVMATHQQDVVDAMRKRVIELDQRQCCARPGKRRLRHGRRLAARRGCEIGKGATDDDGEPVCAARDGGQPSPQRSHDGGCDRDDGGFAHRARRGPDHAPGRQHGDGPVAGRGRRSIIFMEPRASAQEIAAINHEVGSMTPTEITSCRFLDKDQAWAQFKDLFNGQPELVKVMTASAMPTSFQCVPAKAQSITQLASEFRDQPGVYQVGYPGQIIAETLAHFSALRTVALIVAGGVMLGAIALVVNTIQLAIFARRREVAVMKLVGATNWFIRVPFMLEGLVEGLLGARHSFPDHILRPRYVRLVHREQPDRREPTPLRQLPRGPADRAVHRGRWRPGRCPRLRFRREALPVGLT